MSEQSTRRIVSSNSLKLVAGGVSLMALAMLAVGLFSTGPAPISSPSAPAAEAPNSGTTAALSSGDPAIHEAIAKDDAESLRILVESGTDVDARDLFGDPALHTAIKENDPEMVRILVEADANVDAKNSFGDPALHRAILKGNSEMVRILVNAGADVKITNTFGDSALNRAIREDNKEIVQILADAGAAKPNTLAMSEDRSEP